MELHSSFSRLPQVKNIPLKAPVTILAFLQLFIAVIQLSKSTIPFLISDNNFHHVETKRTIQIIFFLTLLWIGFIAILLAGLFTNRPKLILIHFIFCVFMFLYELFLLIILLLYSIHEHIQICTALFDFLIISVSLYFERQVFCKMKENGRDF